MKISRILHAGYVFECTETKIVFDPIFENPFSHNCYAFPDVEFDLEQIKKLKISAVFISHYHDDHCSFDSLNLLDRKTPIYLYCLFDDMFKLIRQLGFENVYSLKIDETVTIGAFQITPRRALDADVDSLFQIQTAEFNILNVVDSWIDDDTLQLLAALKPWDLILWPFQTMREVEVLTPSKALPPEPHLPSEWIPQLQLLNPRAIVPSSCQMIHESWSWYNQGLFPVSYRQFKSEIGRHLPQTEVIRMNPSISLSLSQKNFSFSADLPWIKKMGPQDVDYEFAVGLKAPPTAEIAKHFRELTEWEWNKIKNYCEQSLPQKFAALELSLDRYFATPLTWRLVLYPQTGQPKIFSYRLRGQNLQLTNRPEDDFGWLTELPALKLYTALESGEALTSMYVRVNDAEFSPLIEAQIRKVDVFNDPLIRSLFEGVFAGYQKAQLRKLKP